MPIASCEAKVRITHRRTPSQQQSVPCISADLNSTSMSHTKLSCQLMLELAIDLLACLFFLRCLYLCPCFRLLSVLQMFEVRLKHARSVLVPIAHTAHVFDCCPVQSWQARQLRLDPGAIPGRLPHAGSCRMMFHPRAACVFVMFRLDLYPP